MNLSDTNSNSLYEDLLDGEGTFFRTHAKTIRENISEDIFANFCTLKTNEERISFMYNLDIIHKIELPTSSALLKSDSAALNYKNQGNKCFQKKVYDQAAKCYSYALIQCPQSEGILLATLYANRSAALYYMNKFEKSLQDINLTLSLEYPSHLKYKVQERKARCYLALNDLPRAVDAFQKAMPMLEISSLDTNVRQKKETDFSVMIALLLKSLSFPKHNEEKENRENNLNKSDAPKVAGGINKMFPSASHLVEFTETPVEGRFAIAQQRIEAGQVLVVEKAHCAHLLFPYSKTHCQHCFIRVLYPIPCLHCPNVVFCTVRCRTIAFNTYHKYECLFLGPLWACGSSIVCNLALRLITQKSLQYFVNIQSQLNQKLENKDTTYDASDYRRVYNLCNHQEKRTNIDFFQRTVMAIILLKFLQQTGYFETEPISSQTLSVHENFIGALLLHNLQFLQFNAHEIAELQYDADYPNDIQRAKSQFIGGGLFPTLALFNHSCEPGIVRYFNGSKIIVRSIKPITKGEKIAENYGPIYTQVSKEIRQAELKRRYWFDCLCLPCTENWPTFDDMKTDILPFRCISNRECSGVAFVNIDTSSEFTFPCPQCAEMICVFASLKRLNDTEAMFAKAENLLKTQSYQKALDTFLKIMNILDEILKPPYKDFCLCQQKIRSTMLAFGNVCP